MNKFITDLYLNDRKLQPHLHFLTENIKELHNSKFRKSKDKKSFKINLIQAGYFGIEILNYCEPARFHWRICYF